ncbi:MAG: 50S ribosomal protein L5 [Candidatus Sungbacteria bacterium]|nr:50S ribosomal protein L5 [Candidatus Sungbacteria bacterium]
MTVSMQEKYIKEAIPAMRTAFGYKNSMAVPRISKVVVNIGVGKIREEKDRTEIQKYLALITGQKGAARAAKKAIAAFRTREGLVIGYQVTLRGPRMYDFLSRLVNIALPRTRDFQGLSEGSFDGRGNLTIGVREHIVFPEMIGEDYRMLFGIEITVVTTAHTRKEGMTLIRAMGFPLKAKEENNKK